MEQQKHDWTALQQKIEDDVTHNGLDRGEFVVSAMTKAVENGIGYFIKNNQVEDLPALDIGTGTGYHTAFLIAQGQKQIISVDINPQAIEFARERINHFFPNVPQFNEADFQTYLDKSTSHAQSVNFYNYALDDLIKLKAIKYAMVSFNPPILYPFIDTEFGKPATHGVYYENKDAKLKENDLVYRLYKTIAQENLKKGSHILCIWANLNRHLVETHPFVNTNPTYVHPARILENWFDFKFENEAESFDDFYCHKTILGAGFFNQSETGKLYSDNLRYGIENELYSKLLIPSDKNNLAGTHFQFGVLHLEKTSDTANTFKIINGSSRA